MPDTIQSWDIDLDLREAEQYEVVGTEVTSSNITAGTDTLDVITFTPDNNVEILAMALELSLAATSDAISTVPPRAARQRLRMIFQVTALETFSPQGDRAGDYWSRVFYMRVSEAHADDTNGHASVADPIDVDYWAIMDPGRDQAESKLVLTENESLRVHKRIGDPGIASTEELKQNVKLHVWFEEVPGDLTEVRTDFPQSGSGTTI